MTIHGKWTRAGAPDDPHSVMPGQGDSSWGRSELGEQERQAPGRCDLPHNSWWARVGGYLRWASNSTRLRFPSVEWRRRQLEKTSGQGEARFAATILLPDLLRQERPDTLREQLVSCGGE